MCECIELGLITIATSLLIVFVANILEKRFTTDISIVSAWLFSFMFSFPLAMYLNINPVFLFQKKTFPKMFFPFLVLLLGFSAFAYYVQKHASLETRRKFYHIWGGVLIIFATYFDIELSIVFIAGIEAILIVMDYARKRRGYIAELSRKFLNPGLREDEKEGIAEAAIFFVLSVFFAYWFGWDVGSAVVVVLAFGDTFANYGGRAFGKHRYPWGKKSVEGTVCGFIVSVIGIKLIGFPIEVAFVVSSISMAVESLEFHSDNATVPLVALVTLLAVGKGVIYSIF